MQLHTLLQHSRSAERNVHKKTINKTEDAKQTEIQ